MIEMNGRSICILYKPNIGGIRLTKTLNVIVYFSYYGT